MKNAIIAEFEKKSALEQLVELLTPKDKKDEATGPLAELLMLKDEKRKTVFGG